MRHTVLPATDIALGGDAVAVLRGGALLSGRGLIVAFIGSAVLLFDVHTLLPRTPAAAAAAR